jgi:hypothetical protein
VHADSTELHEEVVRLRQLKRDKLKVKEAALKEIDRLSQELNSVFNKRARLEEQAREANANLDRASTERLQAQNAAKRNADTFHQMSQDLMLLKVTTSQGQKDTLNRVVASTFEDDLRSMRSKESK